MVANSATVELAISGMSCASCVRHVTEALGAVDGVLETHVDLQNHQATVSFNPESVTATQLVRVVEEAGYAATTKVAGSSVGLPIHARHRSCCG